MIPNSNRKRYEMGFDGLEYSKAIEEIKAQFRRLNRSQELFKQLSKDLHADVDSLYALEALISLQTGFRNLDMGADALGVKYEYQELKQLSAAGFPPKESVTTKNGKQVPKEAYLEKLKESFHTYLPVEMRKIYDDLEKACELINEHGPWVRNAVVKTPDNTFVVNIHRVDEAKKYQV